ncbi:uncharacterized protein [Argopecten irradians]|uniref:uncharacterized protein isoform X2 n=2 Tax=Argopecten irradians TaxID=31199 RepID=UPI003720829D
MAGMLTNLNYKTIFDRSIWLCFTLPSAVWLTGLRRRSQWWLAVGFLLRRLWLCTLPAAAEERFSLSLLLTSLAPALLSPQYQSQHHLFLSADLVVPPADQLGIRIMSCDVIYNVL